MNLKMMPKAQMMLKISDAFSDTDKNDILDTATTALSAKHRDVVPYKNTFMVFSSSAATNGDFWNEGVYVRGGGAGELYGPGLYSNWNPEQTSAANYGKELHVFVIKPEHLKNILIADAYIYEKVYKKKPRAMSVSAFATINFLHDLIRLPSVSSRYYGDWHKDMADICKGTGNSYCSDYFLDQIRAKAGPDGVLRFITGCHNITLSDFMTMSADDFSNRCLELESYTPNGLTKTIMKDRDTSKKKPAEAIVDYIDCMCHRNYSMGAQSLTAVARDKNLYDSCSKTPGSVFSIEGNKYKQDSNPCRTAPLLSGYIAGRWTFVYEFGFKAMAYWGFNDKYCYVTRYPNETTDFIGVVHKDGGDWVWNSGTRTPAKFNAASKAARKESDTSDPALKLQHVITEYDPAKAFWAHMKDKKITADVKQIFLTKLITFGAPRGMARIVYATQATSKNGSFFDAFSKVDANIASDLMRETKSTRANVVLTRDDRQKVLDCALAHFAEYFVDKSPKPANVSKATEDLKLPAAFQAVVKYHNDHPNHAVSQSRVRWIFERLVPNFDTYEAFYKAVQDVKDPEFEKIVCESLTRGYKDFPDIAKMSTTLSTKVKEIKGNKLPAPPQKVSGDSAQKGVDAVNRWLANNPGSLTGQRQIWIARQLEPAAVQGKIDLNTAFGLRQQDVLDACSKVYNHMAHLFGADTNKVEAIGKYIKTNHAFPVGSVDSSVKTKLSTSILSAIDWVNQHPGHAFSAARARKFCYQITYDDLKNASEIASKFNDPTDYDNFCKAVGTRYSAVTDPSDVHMSLSKLSVDDINNIGSTILSSGMSSALV